MVSKSAVKKSAIKKATAKPSKKAVSASSVTVDEDGETEGEHSGQKPWLMDLVYQRAVNTGTNILDLTEQLGYSQAYLFHLKSRPWKCTRLGIDTVRKLAEFLQMNPMNVMLAAGIIKPQDFFGVTEVVKIRSELVRTARYISDDPDWAPFVPRPVENLDDQILMLVVSAYQTATGRQIMPFQLPSEAIVEGVKMIKKKK